MFFWFGFCFYIRQSHGLSGRTLRKLPFIAHALFVQVITKQLLRIYTIMKNIINLPILIYQQYQQFYCKSDVLNAYHFEDVYSDTQKEENIVQPFNLILCSKYSWQLDWCRKITIIYYQYTWICNFKNWVNPCVYRNRICVTWLHVFRN